MSDEASGLWIDGTNQIVRIRLSSVETLRNWVHEQEIRNNSGALKKLKVNPYIEEQLYSDANLSKDKGTMKQPIVVFSTVYPKKTLLLLIHLLYSMVEFMTERQCFVNSKLLGARTLTENDARLMC